MTLRGLALALLLPAGLALAVLSGGACSSSSSDTTPGGGGTCGGDPFANDGRDTVMITKAEACARYVKALQKQAEGMKPSPCSLTPVPTCPEVLDAFEANLRKANPGLCIDGYSNGSITNCECRISTYSSCSDFSTKPCVITVIPKAGTCETDAGVDSGADTFETSPLDDAATDAGGGG